MWVLLALLTLGWGFNWPMMKMTLAEMPVWTFRGLCVASGAVGLFILARVGGQSVRVRREQWGRLIAISFCNVTLWNVFIGYGLQMLPAGRSAILAYSMPAWAALLSVFILHEKFTRRRMLGLVLGMAGMAVLLGGEMSIMRASPIGSLFVLGGAIGWALGTVLMRRYPMNLGTTALTAWQLLVGGLPLMIAKAIPAAASNFTASAAREVSTFSLVRSVPSTSASTREIFDPMRSGPIMRDLLRARS